MQAYIYFRHDSGNPEDSDGCKIGPLRVDDEKVLEDFLAFKNATRPHFGIYRYEAESFALDFTNVVAIQVVKAEGGRRARATL
jgi:hypothetical protein